MLFLSLAIFFAAAFTDFGKALLKFVREGAMVVDGEGNEVGKVTSGGFSPTLQAPIAMAYVPTAFATEGRAITLAQRGKIYEAKVVPMPFVPHRYHRKGAAQ